MATERAIDKLKRAFSIDSKRSYPIYRNGELILNVYWRPFTIADRDGINATLVAANRGQEEGSQGRGQEGGSQGRRQEGGSQGRGQEKKSRPRIIILIWITTKIAIESKNSKIQ